MSADDTSREALVTQVAKVSHEAHADYQVSHRGWDDLFGVVRWRYLHSASAVVDAVVMPLVEERDRLLAEAAERVADGFGIRSLKAEGGAMDLTLQANTDESEALLLAMSDACGQMLDRHDATNYVEFTVRKRGRSAYVVHVRRDLGKTPHTLREEAEAERDAARAAHQALTEAVRAMVEGADHIDALHADTCGSMLGAYPCSCWVADLHTILEQHGATS